MDAMEASGTVHGTTALRTGRGLTRTTRHIRPTVVPSNGKMETNPNPNWVFVEHLMSDAVAYSALFKLSRLRSIRWPQHNVDRQFYFSCELLLFARR